jgi:hypothetical protein
MLAVMPLTFFRRANERTTIAATDGDSARLLQLLYNGELLTKTVAAAMCAAVEEDSDRRRYTQLYKLVRANGVGDWSRAIDELCVGTTSQHLCLEARTERRDLTVRVAPDSWQFQAVALIDSCLRTLNPQRQGLPPKLEGRSWFTLFAELRNATRGPRATDTRVELDAFVACQVVGAIEVERAATAHLAKHKDSPVTPFDSGSYTDVLKLIAGNLDSEGAYSEVLARGELVPPPDKHLVVTDAWVDSFAAHE